MIKITILREMQKAYKRNQKVVFRNFSILFVIWLFNDVYYKGRKISLKEGTFFDDSVHLVWLWCVGSSTNKYNFLTLQQSSNHASSPQAALPLPFSTLSLFMTALTVKQLMITKWCTVTTATFWQLNKELL